MNSLKHIVKELKPHVKIEAEVTELRIENKALRVNPVYQQSGRKGYKND